MAEHYNFQPGSFKPVEQADFVPEMEKDYAKVTRDEEDYFNALLRNDQNRADNIKNTYDSLGDISKSLKSLAEAKHKEYVKKEESKGTMLALTKGATQEQLQRFREEEEGLRRDGLKVTEFANQYEKVTGDYVGSEEFHNMSGYAQYAFVKTNALEMAKGWQKYKYDAMETVTVPFNRDGIEQPILYKDAENQFERDAIVNKIKYQFIERFNGINPVLLADVVKPEIDKVDAVDRAQAAREQQEAIVKGRKLAEKREIEVNFVRADPALSTQYALDWVDKYKGIYGISGARLKFKEHLIELVKEEKISPHQAITASRQPFKGNDKTSTKTLTSWNEWSDLEDLLEDAQVEINRKRAAQDEAEIDILLDQLKQGEDYTNEQKRSIAAKVKDKFNYLPVDIYNFLQDYEDDDAAKAKLDIALKAQDNKLYQFQLRNMSPTITKQYQGYVAAGGALETGSQNAKAASEYIQIKTKEILKSGIALTDIKSTKFFTLQTNLEKAYNDAYRNELKAGGTTTTADKVARAEIVDISIKPERWKPLTVEKLELDEEDKAQKENLRNSNELSAYGGWKTNLLPLTEADEEALLKWNGEARSVPRYMRELARHIKVGSDLQVAKAQQALLKGEPVEEIDEEQFASNNKIIQNLVFTGTRSSLIRANMMHEQEKSGVEINAKNSIFNKKAAMTPGV